MTYNSGTCCRDGLGLDPSIYWIGLDWVSKNGPTSIVRPRGTTW